MRWQEFCARHQFEDGILVSEAKVVMWLQEDLFKRRVAVPSKKPRSRLGKRKRAGTPAAAKAEIGSAELALAAQLEIALDDLPAMVADDRGASGDEQSSEDEDGGGQGGSLLKFSTIEVYVAAVAELWSVQLSMGLHSHALLRGPALNQELDKRRSQSDQQARQDYADRGAGGLNSGYTDAEFLQMNKLLLVQAAQRPQSLRTRVDALFGHYLVLRGQARRMAELCDLSIITYPRTEGPTPCHAVVLQTTNGKTNRNGKKNYMGAMRHKDPYLCTMGALAQYLFWRWHISGELQPSFKRRKDWYNTKLLVGDDKDTEIAYNTQYTETWKAFAAAGINSVQKTHVMRGAGARAAELHGVSEQQINRAGLWSRSSMTSAYLTGLPLKFLRKMAGFTASEGSYHIARAGHQPPAGLLLQVWPWIEEWDRRFAARAEKRRWKEGGLDDEDLAGAGFLQLMKQLREVLLQDLAVLQPRRSRSL
ncbi:MAG: hypothetical protein QOI89_3920 [Solirubrobacteraceae bacterium]|nr:hypothetical protein [Solirubrobacteraceae bacterium]